MPVSKFLCFPLNSWHFKSATQPVPLYATVQLRFPPVPSSALSSSRQHVMHKYAGRASYLQRRLFPTRCSENWSITTSSPFARLRAVLSETKTRGEQNRAQLCYVKLRQNAQVCTRPFISLFSSLQLHRPNFFILNKKRFNTQNCTI